MNRLGRQHLFAAIVLVVVLQMVLRLGGIWWARLPHPFDLEWMEGGMLAHAWRLQHGLELYPVPDADFAPYVYPPGYSSLLAVLGAFRGLDYLTGRLVSLLSTLGAATVLGVGVARHGGSRVVGIASAAAFLGCFPASGGFYDLVRPDAMAMCLLACAIVAGLERARGAAVAAGLLLAAAWITKHNAAAYGVPLLLGITLRDGWRRGATFAAASAGPALLLTAYMQAVTGGRFLTYLLEVPGSHPMVGARAFPGVPGELGTYLAVATVSVLAWLVWRVGRAIGAVGYAAAGLGLGVGAAIAWLVPAPTGVPVPEQTAALVAMGAVVGAGVFAALARVLSPRRRSVSWQWVYGVGVGAVAIVTAAMMRAHHGGFMNVLMPLHWSMCFAMGIALSRWQGSGVAHVRTSVVAAVLVTQLWWLAAFIDPHKLEPTDEDLRAGAEVLEALRSCEGPILSPYAAWLPAQAGHWPSRHLITIWDLNHEGGPFFDVNAPALRDAAAEGYWACVVYGTRPVGFTIDQHYPRQPAFDIPARALMPRTGWRVRPTAIGYPVNTR